MLIKYCKQIAPGILIQPSILFFIVLSILSPLLPTSATTYQLIAGTSNTWFAAEAACIAQFGLSLATITDSTENAAALTTCLEANANACWIGANDIQTEGVWKWSQDGTNVTYTNWTAGEPNGGGTSNCVQLYTFDGYYGFWDDTACTASGSQAVLCNDNKTVAPTNDPTSMPTLVPTDDPTSMPTLAPTFSPSINNSDCEQRGFIYHHNWDNNSVAQKPYSEYSISIDSSTTITFYIVLEYIGNTTINSVYGYGVTYVIDFQAFHFFNNHINETGSCSNRMPQSFLNVTSFADYWLYSNTPYVDGHLSSVDYLAYPPPGNWNLSVLSTANPWIQCNRILYKATLNWNDLILCSDADGSKLITISADTKHINLTGVLYVNMVSPEFMTKDSGVYRVKEILQNQFKISISTSAHIIASTGVQQFTVVVYYASRVFNYSSGTLDGSYSIMIATQTADYVSFATEGYSIVTAPAYDWNISPINNFECSYANQAICIQYWKISTNSIQCPISFDGTFGLRFTAVCNINISANNIQLCTNYLSNYGSNVTLTFDFGYSDNAIRNCTSNTVTKDIQFTGNLSFFEDSTFTKNEKYNNIFETGSVLYGEIFVDIPSNILSLYNIELVNIWICSINPIYAVNATIDQQNVLYSGCFNTAIVDSDSVQNIMINNVSQGSFDVQIISESENDISRFSFITPSWTVRNMLYVHCEVAIYYMGNSSGRRRLLRYSNNIRQLFHSMSGVQVEDEQQESGSDSESISSSLYIIIGIAVGVILIIMGVIIGVFIAFVFYKKRLEKMQIKKENAIKNQLQMTQKERYKVSMNERISEGEKDTDVLG